MCATLCPLVPSTTPGRSAHHLEATPAHCLCRRAVPMPQAWAWDGTSEEYNRRCNSAKSNELVITGGRRWSPPSPLSSTHLN
ncbi:hypothetical protein RSOLAG22IIIB_10276 [Rhizoctonia solani]|uniref:Uncharacterized protein n=1 Tax=Rhizoctonia solani TaxID=456999 RepID=A0A0K6G2W5_9AGAM|nr:hypothetical protein RSOLAG22IIIB_10276 [Rhizoctonia solani]